MPPWRAFCAKFAHNTSRAVCLLLQRSATSRACNGWVKVVIVCRKHMNVFVALVFGVAIQANAQELVFASKVEAQRILSTKDAFLERMSPFDRAARMKTDHDVSELEFIEFVKSSTLEWTEHEKNAVETAYKNIQTAIARLSLPLPDKFYVIKTSGNEEGNAAYTRGNSVVLPKNILSSSEDEIKRLLAHELFHISSRNNPKLANLLYETIGFHYCGEIVFPSNLASRKITNPDAPMNNYCIQLKLGKETVWAVPVLFSRVPQYHVSRGGEFFEHLQLAFVLVEQPVVSGAPRMLYNSRVPRLVTMQHVSGFFDKVGENTDYIIHPEEILADNFALLVLDKRDVRSPEVLSRMQYTLETANKDEQIVPLGQPKAARH